jgi:hypothetical protein
MPWAPMDNYPAEEVDEEKEDEEEQDEPQPLTMT